MVITGSLVVGDSVKMSLARLSVNRLGQVNQVLVAHERWFRAAVAQELADRYHQKYAAVVHLPAFASNQSNDASLAVSLYGIDASFLALAPHVFPGHMAEEGVYINRQTALRLKIKTGDFIAISYFLPANLPGEAPLSQKTLSPLGSQLKVVGILASQHLGDFNQAGSQKIPANVFLDRRWLSKKLARPFKANMLLTASQGNLLGQAKSQFKLADYGLQVKPVKDTLQLTSQRIFMSDTVAAAAAQIAVPQIRILSYFVNRIAHDEQRVPYSFVAGVEGAFLPAKIKADEVIVTRWLANQLKLAVGDSIALSAYVQNVQGELEQGVWPFKVHAIVPLAEPYLDREMMPPFPGISAADSCGDWDPAIPLDLSQISDADELYWQHYRGSPKLFLPLKTAQRIWKNRFGSLTAIRFAHLGAKELEARLLEKLQPEKLGYIAYPLKQEAGIGVDQSLDFAGLTLGLSFFIIVGALMLTHLLFQFYLEQREHEFGVLTSLGFRPGFLGRGFIYEGVVCSLGAVILGTGGGIVFAQLILWGLNSLWVGAVHTNQLYLYFSRSSMLMGGGVTFVVVIITILLSVRKFMRGSQARQIKGESQIVTLNPRSHFKKGSVLTIGAILCALVVPYDSTEKQMAIFFSGGVLLLLASYQWSALILVYLSRRKRSLNLLNLALQNGIRKPRRSLTVIGLFAWAIFLLLAITANRKTNSSHPEDKKSGTGGFALFMETALPIDRRINSPTVRQDFKLEALGKTVQFFPLPTIKGSEASCLNLNRVVRPPITAVTPQDFKGRFSFKSVLPGLKPEWSILNTKFKTDDVIPAVADMDVIQWVLGKKLGDELVYQGARGKIFRLRLVGGLANSLFQGQILVAKEHFNTLFPDHSGSHLFLIDAPAGRMAATKKILSQVFHPFGLALEATGIRLNRFNAVQNTYLSIFLVLGAIGMLLGCVGLAVLLRRNLLERQAELGYLQVIGFSLALRKKLFFYEHFFLLTMGLGWGFIAAFPTFIPVILSPTGQLPLSAMLTVILLLILAGAGTLLVALHTHKDRVF